MAGNLGKHRGRKYGPKPPPPPKNPAPSAHAVAEHKGKVPQPGVHTGPRQTVPALPSSPAASKPIYNPTTTHYEPSPTAVAEHKGKIPGAGGLPGAAKANAAHTRQAHLSAAAYHAEALNKITAKNFKIVDGAIKTKPAVVPDIKTSPKAITHAHKRLDSILTDLKHKGGTKAMLDETESKGSEIIARENYRITPDNKLATHTVQVPVLKTSAKHVKKELEKVNKTTKEIAEGKKHHPIIIKGSAEHRTFATGIAGAITDVTEGAVKGAVHAAEAATTITVPTERGKPAPKVHLGREIARGLGEDTKLLATIPRTIARGVHQQQMQEDMVMNRGGLGFVTNARQDINKGVRSGVLAGGEMATRLGLAVKQQIARELAGDMGPLNTLTGGLVGKEGELFLTPQAQKKFAKADPLEAILHGHSGKNIITGGDLGEQLFGLRQLGLPIDIATDPLMYLGGAGLLAKFGERGAALIARLEASAPEVLGDPAVTNAIKYAQESGDWEGAEKLLRAKAEERGVSLLRLTKTKGDKKAIQKYIIGPRMERGKEVETHVIHDMENAPVIKGRKLRGNTKVYLGGKADVVATEQQTRKFLEKRLRPGFQLEIRTPLGRKLGGVNVPIPRKLAERRFIPQPAAIGGFTNSITEGTKMLREMRKLGAQEPIYQRIAKEYDERLNTLDNLEYGTKEWKAAKAELDTFDGEIEGILLDARLSAENRGLGQISPAEWIERYNSRRFHHEVARFTRTKGRNVQQKGMYYVKKATHPIRNSKKSKIKVGLYMHLRHDTGSLAILEKVLPLSNKERRVMEDLDKVYGEMERYGLAVGTLPHGGIEDYVPRYPDLNEDIFGGLHDSPKSKEVVPMGGAAGSESAFMRHRGLFEMASLSDKNRLVNAIERIAPKGTDRGLIEHAAEQWYRTGRVQMVLEDMIQTVQRGTVLKWDELTAAQRKAYQWQLQMRSNKKIVEPIFKGVDATDGRLVLNPDGIAAQRDLVEVPFDGLSSREEAQARIASALEGRQRLLEAAETVEADNPALAEDYRQIAAQRDSEVSQIRDNFKPERRLTPKKAVEPKAAKLKTTEEPVKTTEEPVNMTWKKPTKGVSHYVRGDGAELEKNAEVGWTLTRKDGTQLRVATLKAGKEAAEPPAPPDVGAMTKEHEAIVHEIPKQENELRKLQGEVGKQEYVVALKSPDGKVIKYLPRQTDRNSAELSAESLNDSGHLPPNTTAEAVTDPSTSAAMRKEAAEAYAKKAEHVESMEVERDRLKSQLDDLQKQTKADVAKVTTKIRTAPPEPAATIDPAAQPVASEVGLPSDEEIADMVPNATEEYVGTMKDLRKEHPRELPILDPMLANYHRTRAEGLQTIFRTRWAALDKAVGRSTVEAHAGRWTAVDGRSGYTYELKPVFEEGGDKEPIAYIVRDTGEEVAAHDIEFHDSRTLIPMGERSIWIDPVTGREYIPATNLEPQVSEAIEQMIGKNRLWPSDVVANARFEFLRFGDTGVRDLYDVGITGLTSRALSLTRFGVTTLFPAYHFRNMLSDVIQGMMGDFGILFHPIANTKIAYQVMRRGGSVQFALGDLTKEKMSFTVGHVHVPGWGKIPTEDYLAVMDAFGLRSNQHLAELAILAERGDVRSAEKWYQRVTNFAKQGGGLGPSGIFGRNALEFGARREDVMRAITFTQRMRRNGGDFADAAWWTIKHHFDYGDLNLFERRVLRNAFLFYTWYRKNIPLQFMTMIRRPGFFSTVANTYIDASLGETPINFDWSKINPILPNMEGPMPHSGLVPDYMFNQLAAIGSNWNGHAMVAGFGAPFADMNLITHFFESPEEGTRVVMGLLNPLATFLPQFALKTELLTGREYQEREASGPAELINWFGSKFGFELPKDDTGAPTLPWAANLFVNYLPVIGRASGYARSTPVTEDQGRFNKWFGGAGLGSFATGINAYVGPGGGERLDLASISRVMAWGQQRKQLAESMTNEKSAASKAKLHQFDEQVRERAQKLGIPFKYFTVVPAGWEFYKTQEEREGFHISPGNIGENSELGGLETTRTNPLGSSLNLQTHKEYNSLDEEAIEKLNNRGAFEEFHIKEGSLVPFSGSALPGGEYTGEENVTFNLGHKEQRLSENTGKAPVSKVTPQGNVVKPAKPSGGNLGKTSAQQFGFAEPKPKATKATHGMTVAQQALHQPLLSQEAVRRAIAKPGKTAIHKIYAQYPELELNNAGIAIAGAAKKFGVPASILASIYKTESASGTNPGTSSAGALGPMQFIQSTWEEHGILPNGQKAAPGDIVKTAPAIYSAAAYLKAAGWVTGDPQAEHDAIYSYNHADWYVEQIQRDAQAYQSPAWGKADGAEAALRTIAGNKRFAFPAPGWQNSRTDMGKDFAYTHEGQPILALSSGTIVKTSPGEEHWEGGNGFLLKLDNAKGVPSQYVYYYEGIVPTVKPGDKVKKGQLVGEGGITGSIEIGWANSEGVPLSVSEHSEGAHAETKYGLAMSRLLTAVHKGKTRIPVSLTRGGTAIRVGETGYSGGTTGPSTEGEITPGYHPGRATRQGSLLERIERGEVVGGSSSSSSSSGGIAGNPLLTNTEAYNLGGTASKRPGQQIVEEIQAALAGNTPELISQHVKKPKYKPKIR